MVMTPITALEKPLFSGNAQCSKLNLPNAIHLILATTLGQGWFSVTRFGYNGAYESHDLYNLMPVIG